MLREQMAAPGTIIAPGAADAMVAKLIQKTGFSVVYATGAGIANAMLGLPDIGLTTMTEMVDQCRRIADAVDIPVIADGDTGFGNAINVGRTIREYERAGLAAIQLEDQVSPKKCGHFDGKQVVETDEMVQKIRAAVDARRDPDFAIIARTDAIAIHGFDDAVQRARRYADAGADIIFVEAPTSREMFASLPGLIDRPLIANMTEGAKSPLLSQSELSEMGYKIAIFPNMALRIAMKAVQDGLQVLAADGTSANILDRLATWEVRQNLVGTNDYVALERKYASS